MDIANLHIHKGGQESGDELTERQKGLFMRFMHLLSMNMAREHTVAFYASELCVTRQYLNRISKLNSNKTAYDWICLVLTREITKRLEATDDTMLQVSEYFNFPDQASLTKFYKHHTGHTPTEYKKKLAQKWLGGEMKGDFFIFLSKIKMFVVKKYKVLSIICI